MRKYTPIRLTISLFIVIFLLYDLHIEPVFTDKPILSYIRPGIEDTKFIPKDVDYYTQETPAKAIIIIPIYDFESEYRDYNTQIKYKNIYGEKIKIDKVVLTHCDESFYEFKQTLNETTNRVKTTERTENSTIEVNQVFELNKFIPIGAGNFDRINLDINYKSFLNLEPSYIPTIHSSYWCYFNLYQKDEVLYSVKSIPFSNDYDMMSAASSIAMGQFN